eukprot:TRINITY_DN4005_c0_g1_i25.p1 TRINITY_DN4005_c0_g1~~TRINITY_DN4005_c0_g1_i25.p1  ORF type:complete len:106 (-),score=12.52 TRINITY_DN4005_c0_g1_i25:65-382(-)
MAGDAAGPQSAHVNTTMTEDTGKYVGASASATTGYRTAGDAVGPQSAHTQTVMTEDTGKYTGTTDSATSGYAVARASSDGPKFCPGCGAKSTGARFCSECGNKLF